MLKIQVTCGRGSNAQHFIPSHLTEIPPENPAPPSAPADLETDVDRHFHFYHICRFTIIDNNIPARAFCYSGQVLVHLLGHPVKRLPVIYTDFVHSQILTAPDIW